jgi:hypothetical protein
LPARSIRCEDSRRWRLRRTTPPRCRRSSIACRTVGYESLTWLIATGALPDADATFTVLVEHGDAANLSDAAAVPDEQLVGTEALASFIFSDDNKCFKIGYIGGKRYVPPHDHAGEQRERFAALRDRPPGPSARDADAEPTGLTGPARGAVEGVPGTRCSLFLFLGYRRGRSRHAP